MFAITGITGKLPDTDSIVRRGLPRVAAIAMSLVALEASSQPTNQPADLERASIMTMKDDLANRSTDIHWPPGFDPLNADPGTGQNECDGCDCCGDLLHFRTPRRAEPSRASRMVRSEKASPPGMRVRTITAYPRTTTAFPRPWCVPLPLRSTVPPHRPGPRCARETTGSRKRPESRQSRRGSSHCRAH
jgi:hypothetical protein